MLQFWYTGADKYNESQPDKDKSLGHLGWMDGVMALGVNF